MTRLQSTDFSTARILLVDDEPFFLSVVRDNLRRCDFSSVLTAGSGRKALDMLQNQEVELLISDINMQPVSGLELVRRVRTGEVSGGEQLPVIFLTGLSDKEMVEAAAVLNIDGFIRKPVAIKQLQEITLKVLGSSAKRKRPPISDEDQAKVRKVEERFNKSEPIVKPSVQDMKIRKPLFQTNTTDKLVGVGGLSPGMRLIDDILTEDGHLLLRAGTCLSEEQVNRLGVWTDLMKSRLIKVQPAPRSSSVGRKRG